MAYIPRGVRPSRRGQGLGILEITIPTGPLPQTSAADWFSTQEAANINNAWTTEQLALAREGLPINRGYEQPSLLPGIASPGNWMLYAAGALLVLALIMSLKKGK